MSTYRTLVRCVVAVAAMASYPSAQAVVISGTISDWPESGPVLTIGDGNNHVSIWWSINTSDRGFFYGSSSTGDSDVAYATGITDVTQITDASSFAFTSGAIGPYCDADCDPDGVGEFIVWQNLNTAHFGVLRIDDIIGVGGATLNGTWWFQTDGSGDFSAAIPLPAGLPLLLSALALVTTARRRKSAL